MYTVLSSVSTVASDGNTKQCLIGHDPGVVTAMTSHLPWVLGADSGVLRAVLIVDLKNVFLDAGLGGGGG